MIEQKMEGLVYFFKHYFVSGRLETEDQQNPANSDKDTEEQGSVSKKEPPVYWEFIDDRELKPGYKKTYCYLTKTWAPCDKKDAQIVYVSIFDEDDVCVDTYHARKREKRNPEN